MQPADLSLTRDTRKVNLSESSVLQTMSLSDLDSRMEQVLRLGNPSDNQSGTRRTYIPPGALKYLRHFHSVLVAEDYSSARSLVEVLEGDMLRVAFTVCTEISNIDFPSAVRPQ